MSRAALMLALLLFALPAMAQAQPAPQPPRAALAVPGLPDLPRLPEMQQVLGITPGHAAALGAGLFAGAMAGSVLINGGAFAAAIGGVAGVLIGNWYWNEHHGAED